MPDALAHADRTLVRALRRALKQAAVPADAEPMQRYMKSAMPYLGVKKPARAAATRPLFAEHALPDWPALRDTVLMLWREAKHREERYVAIDLSRQRAYRPFHRPAALGTFEELVVTGAWWDYVDEVAKHNVGTILQASPKGMSRTLRAWAKDDDLWKRRTAILAQLGFKKDTDATLLADCIAPSLGADYHHAHRGPGQSQGHPMIQKDVDFFIRKAIGWALREYAKSEPQWVVDYVYEHAKQLPRFSQKEALRVLISNGFVDGLP